MFEVRGYINSVSYAVRVADNGEVTATGRARTLLDLVNGESVALSPTGPFVVADTGTPEGILAALHVHTQVTSVTGDPPQIMPASDPSVVY